MLVSSTARYHNKMTNPLSMKTLEDVTEHKEYGNFAIFDKQYTPSTCDFLGKHCSSEEEWDLLAKPYMEE